MNLDDDTDAMGNMKVNENPQAYSPVEKTNSCTSKSNAGFILFRSII